MMTNIDGWFLSQPATYFPYCEICEENEHDVCFETPGYDPQTGGGDGNHYCTCTECAKRILPKKCFLWIQMNININIHKTYFEVGKNE